MYKVFENNKPASWLNYSFKSIDEAIEETKKFFNNNQYWCSLPQNFNGSPYDYSGYGDMIEIRFIKE